jgi:hypothetical protein
VNGTVKTSVVVFLAECPWGYGFVLKEGTDFGFFGEFDAVEEVVDGYGRGLGWGWGVLFFGGLFGGH